MDLPSNKKWWILPQLRKRLPEGSQIILLKRQCFQFVKYLAVCDTDTAGNPLESLKKAFLDMWIRSANKSCYIM